MKSCHFHAVSDNYAAFLFRRDKRCLRWFRFFCRQTCCTSRKEPKGKLKLHTIWSRDTCQQIPCFDRCQLIITCMPSIKEVAACLYQPIIWSMATMLHDSTAVVTVVRTRPRGMPLAMITMRNHFMGFLEFLIWLWGSAWQSLGLPELL